MRVCVCVWVRVGVRVCRRAGWAGTIVGGGGCFVTPDVGTMGVLTLSFGLRGLLEGTGERCNLQLHCCMFFARDGPRQFRAR